MEQQLALLILGDLDPYPPNLTRRASPPPNVRRASKLGPLIPGELLLDTFELARDIRLLDMQAAPYELSAWGVQPVRIETPDGKAEYVRQQRGFAERGAVLRERLLHAWLGTEPV